MSAIFARAKLLTKPKVDADTDQFIRFCKRKWPRATDRHDAPVVLVGQRPWRPSICANAVLANFLARSRGWSIHCGFFGRRESKILDHIHEAFGCEITLNWRTAAKHKARSARISRQVLSNMRAKEDIFDIAVAGVPVGDLIYDTYLRYYLLPTVDLSDSRLHHLIHQTVLAALACEEYFATYQVGAYLAYDAPYIESGIMHRFAVRDGIPVYCALTPAFGVYQMDGEIRGDPADYRNWPSKTGASLHNRQKFRALTLEEQTRARELARQQLEARLNGGEDRNLLPAGNSAYAVADSTKVLRQTGRPRILVLLHDFCDAPNVLRWSLFPDFCEWLNFLLRHAQQTSFDWYVKPHPHRHSDDAKALANDKIVAEFKRRYPRVTFLEPSVSNRQLIDEGISSMFTVHGTAAHEFAYLGIPVVNAGYNHHINYSFNIHAYSKEQYSDLIMQAGYLAIDIDKSEIEEFVYTHFVDLPKESAAWLIPPEFHLDSKLSHLQATSRVYREFIALDGPQRDSLIANYLKSYFNH